MQFAASHPLGYFPAEKRWWKITQGDSTATAVSGYMRFLAVDLLYSVFFLFLALTTL